jgi:hypothetical protein
MLRSFFTLALFAGVTLSHATFIVGANGGADTNVTAINTKGSGTAIGVSGVALSTSGTGIGVNADGLHYGLKVKAGPGTGDDARGVAIQVNGAGLGTNFAWGTATSVSSAALAVGHDASAQGDQAVGYQASSIVGDELATGFTAGTVYGESGNASGFEAGHVTSVGGTEAFGVKIDLVDMIAPGWAFGSRVASVNSDAGYAAGNWVSYVTGDLNTFGFSAYDVHSLNGYAYGLQVVDAHANNGAYGVLANANSASDAYGLYGTGNSTNGGLGVGVYGYGSASGMGGVAAAGVFDGDVYVSGSSCSFCSPSDEMFKKNVQPMRGSLKTILSLKPKTYEMKVDEFKDRISLSKGPQRGFLAQDLEKVVPELVHPVTWPARLSAEERANNVKKTGLKFKSVNYMELIPVLVQAMQEQQAVIEALEAKIARLEAR